MKRVRLILFALLLWGSVSFGQVSKIAPDLLNLLGDLTQPVEVIVQFDSQPGLLNITQLLSLGGVIQFQYVNLPAIAVTLPAVAVDILALDPAVTYISPNRALESLSDNLPDLNTASADADLAYEAGYTGAGVGIAIVDSGIYAHPDLAGRIVYNQNFVAATNADDYGHGTHVAGIAAGSGASSDCAHCTQTYRGIAPGANLINLRALDQNGMSSDAVVIAAIDKAISLKSQYNIRVMNLSIGRPIYESSSIDPLCKAVATAWKSGIVVVVAAGNLGRNGYSTIISPGNDPYVITVGAMKSMGTPQRSDDLIASYSSRGPTWIDFTAKPDVVAPGNLVGSLLAPGSTLSKQYPGNIIAPSTYGSTGASEYFTLSGTSMATPVVSGTAALMIGANPSLTPDTVKARIMLTASKTFPLSSVAVDPTTGMSYVDFYDIYTIGAGYADTYKAVTNQQTSTGYAYSPTVVWNPITSTAILTNSVGSLWNNGNWSIANVWGTQVVQGIGGTSAAWGDGGIWGSSAAWGDSGIWGTSAAWGDAGAWSTSAAWGDSVNGVGEQN
jgi:serine protease AprX